MLLITQNLPVERFGTASSFDPLVTCAAVLHSPPAFVWILRVTFDPSFLLRPVNRSSLLLSYNRSDFYAKDQKQLSAPLLANNLCNGGISLIIFVTFCGKARRLTSALRGLSRSSINSGFRFCSRF